MKNILSLFDGIGVARLALDRAGIKVNQYVASEIDKEAIKVVRHHYPDVIQLGCVQTIDKLFFSRNLDLIIGGSPCQGFSFSGKRLNFDDPRSALFFTFVKLLHHYKPKYFILENVVMKQEWQDVITEHLQAYDSNTTRTEICSSLVSAQVRKRNYWTNFPITQPEDKGITLCHILEDVEWNHPAAVRGRRLNKATIIGRRLTERGTRSDYDKSVPITQCLEVRKTNTDKSNCITTCAKDNVLTPLEPGRYPDAFGKISGTPLPFRYYTITELHRLQTLPDQYCTVAGVSNSKAASLIGNAFTCSVIEHILSHIK